MRSVLLIIMVAGCGSRAAAPVRPEEPAEPVDRWETVQDERLVYPGGCGTGPFEVTLPARDFEFGRRVVFQVYGPRKVAIDNQLWTEATQWGIAMPSEEGDHARCRLDAGEAPATVAVTAPVTPGRPGKSRKRRQPAPPPRDPARPTDDEKQWDPPAARLPMLVPYTGELPAAALQAGAVAFLPLGDPTYYADEYFTPASISSTKPAIRIRFWLSAPSDLDGVVFRFLDQRLVPDQPLDQFRITFAERVRATKARKEASKPRAAAAWDARIAACKANPDTAECREMNRVRGRMPPPPRAELRPRAPGPNVDWIPGHWTYSDEVGDHLWVDGTYVVRAPPVVATVEAPAPPAPVAAPPPAPLPEPVVAEPPRTIDASIAAPPPPRVEVLPPPPPLVGAIWIAGHWRLHGSTWRWSSGHWIVPPRRGELYRAPSVRVRDAVRIYIPGGWIRVR